MNKVYSLLGLCMRAGMLVSGEFMVEKAIRADKVKLVIVAEDASDNTKKKFRNMCNYRKLELMIYGDKSSLGAALGKEIRASIGITDENFAKNILSKID